MQSLFRHAARWHWCSQAGTIGFSAQWFDGERGFVKHSFATFCPLKKTPRNKAVQVYWKASSNVLEITRDRNTSPNAQTVVMALRQLVTPAAPSASEHNRKSYYSLYRAVENFGEVVLWHYQLVFWLPLTIAPRPTPYWLFDIPSVKYACTPSSRETFAVT